MDGRADEVESEVDYVESVEGVQLSTGGRERVNEWKEMIYYLD